MISNLDECKATVEAILGPLEWGRVDAERQGHVSWEYTGSPIDQDRYMVPATLAMKSYIQRKKVVPVKANLHIAKNPDGGAPIAVLRVAYA